jgi:hypothetical protein
MLNHTVLLYDQSSPRGGLHWEIGTCALERYMAVHAQDQSGREYPHTRRAVQSKVHILFAPTTY